MTDPTNRRTLHFNLRIPFVRVGFYVSNTALEIAQAEADAHWQSSFGEAISEAAKLLAGVLVQHKDGARSSHVYRISVPPAWAAAHPHVFEAFKTFLAPVPVDTLTTCVDLATFWQDGQAVSCEAMTEDGLPEHVLLEWHRRSR